MRNRAKCRLCGDILESFHPTDHVTCKCDQISLSGGEAMTCYAKDFANLIRIDDSGEEVIPKIIQEAAGQDDDQKDTPSKEEILDMMLQMIKSFDNLPSHAMMSPVTNTDLKNVLLLVYAALKE